MIWIFTTVVYHGGEGLISSLCVCVYVCVESVMNFEKHTHNANSTPTYFNLVPAFISFFDKLGNYNNEIALRP